MHPAAIAQRGVIPVTFVNIEWKIHGMATTLQKQETYHEDPEFLNDIFTFAIEKNLCVGAEVGRVGVVCASSTDYTLTFSLTASDGGGNDMKYFKIDPESGRISLKRTLDDSKKVYKLEVVATDNSIPSQSSTAAVNIYVLSEDN